MFDTIFLKQIPPLTQFMVLRDSWMFASQDKMIYNPKKKTRFLLCELNYVSFSLFDSNAYAQNIFSLGEFLQNFIFMNKRLWIYTLVNRYTIQE